MAKYTEKSQEMVKEKMHEMKEGKLKSGSGKKVKNPKQAIAIGLSEARKEGENIPKKKTSRKKTSTSGNKSKTTTKSKGKTSKK